MQSKSEIIGVTGGIGSGKTTVCKIFEVLGATTYYADDRARWLMENDSELVLQIKNLFGERAFSNEKLDRKFIASQVFNNESQLKKLNGLVHPAVAKDVAQWAIRNQNANLLLKEAALLFETGSYKNLKKNILVTAPEEVRIERVTTRDSHRSAQDVKDIIRKQMDDREKISLADFVIENDGKKSLIMQVMKIYESLVVT